MRAITLILFGLLSIQIQAQDTTTVLTYKEYITLVMSNHPYAYQADIVAKQGDAVLKESRGAFDPKLFGDVGQKYFDQVQYYSQINSGLKIPTWFGITAEAGYELNDGAYLNPQQRTPDVGLWYAGLRIELGNGLLIDERRAQLKKAKLYEQNGEISREILLNKLKRDASMAYFDWQVAYKKTEVYEQAYTNASNRFKAVQQAAVYGDRPYIDTIEASISVQNRYLDLIESRTKLENTEIKLEMYLWLAGFIPLEVEDAIPEIDQNMNEITLLNTEEIVNDHPFVQQNDLLTEEQRIDLRLKKEQLKPNLTLKYNALTAPVNGNIISEYSPSNYTWGISLAYPILTRKERAAVELTELKLQDQEIKNVMTQAELFYLIQSAYNNYRVSLDKIETARLLLENSESLYNAERVLFNLGESSIFMINSRESQWLKAKVQLVEVENENRQILSELNYLIMNHI